MNVFSTKVNGCILHVLYSGLQYIMYSEYFGVVGIADRKSVDGQFKLTIGNRHTLGGALNDSTVERAFKSVITKSERKFFPCKEVKYEVEHSDLADKQIQIIVK